MVPARDVVATFIDRFDVGQQIAIGSALAAIGVLLVRFLAMRAERLVGPRQVDGVDARLFHPALLPLTLFVWLLAAKATTALGPVKTIAADGSTRLDLHRVGVAALIVAATLLAFLIGWTRQRGAALAALGLDARSLAPSCALALLAYVAFAPVQLGTMFLHSGICAWLGITLPEQASVAAFRDHPAWHGDPLVIAGIVLAAPLLEELLYRAVLLRFALRWLPRAAAIAAVAVLFALMHDAGQPTVLVLGLALTWLMARTGNLAAPLLFHALHNGLTLFVLAHSENA